MTAPAAAPARQSLLGNLLLSVAVFAVVLGGLEGFCRLREPPRPEIADYIWDWQRKWDGDFYTMKSDANGWPPWEEFNADGMRDRTHAVEKPEGVQRIVFLGDSVTLGDQVPAAEAYPRFLADDLESSGHPVEIFNVALWGWSTRQERIAYERIARKYKPDQVVLAVCLNDIPELQNNLSQPSGWLAWLHERSALVRRIVNAPAREIGSVEELFASPEPEKVKAGFERFFAEVRALRDEVQRDGAAFAMVVFPFRFQVQPGAPPARAQQRIAAFCRADRVRCLDLLTTLAAAGPDAFVDYDHLSAGGARVVARTLRTKGLIPYARGADAVVMETCAGSCPSLVPWMQGRGPAAPARDEVARLLDRSDVEPRAAAAWVLARMGSDAAPVVQRLAALLDDPSEAVRRAGARALGALGNDALPAAEALFARLDDPRQSVRWEAARALANQTQDPQQALPRLTAALRSEDPFLRGFAAWRLGEMGAAAGPAVPALVEALARDEGYGRGGASGALAKIGPAAAAAVPALVEGLKSGDGDRRWKAARTLGRIGPAARDATPALIASISDPNEHVRAHAVRALARVASRSPEIEQALARARRDRVAAVAKEARVATQEMGIAPPADALRARPLAAVGVGAAMALLATLALTPWVRDAARRRGWLDAPDGRLKTHAVAVPHVGGVATYLAFGVGLVASAHPAWGGGWHGGALFVAMGAVLLLGLAHDLSPIWAPVRLGLQAAAALGLCAQVGVVRTVALPGGGAFDLGVFGWPLTVLWLVGVSNAFNLIDGLDGLAAGSGSLSLGVLVVAALAHGDPSAPAAAALAGALLGFLRYNRSPASIFLGDAGSLSVGFALAALALQTTTNDAGELALPVAVLALGLPLAEAAFTLSRRLRLGRSLFTPDREHLHDRLLARGLDRETAARALVSLGGTCACLGWLLAVARPQSKLWALAGALVSLAVGLWNLRRARGAPPPASAAEAAGASRS